MKAPFRLLCTFASMLAWSQTTTAFPSETAVAGERPMLLIVSHDSTNAELANDADWYRRRVFGGTSDLNVRDYFIEHSRGWLRYNEAQTISVEDDASDELNRLAGVQDWQDNARRIGRAVYLVAQTGFNFMAYDISGDGRVSAEELTIIVVQNYTDEDRGIMLASTCVNVPGTQLCSNMVLLAHRASFSSFAHEVAHTIVPSAVDLYGARNRCLSHRMTLMSCGGEFSVFLDPWHRARYGWQGPTLQASATDVGSTFVVAPVANPEFDPEVLTITGPNGREAFTFEVRGVHSDTYDDVIAPPRILLGWYSRLDDERNLAKILALAPPRQNLFDLLRFAPRGTQFLPRLPWFSLPTPQPPARIPIETDGSFRVARQFEPGLTTLRRLLSERGTDTAMFTLGSFGNCELDPLSNNSRGIVTDLANGDFELRWSDGSTTTFHTREQPGFRFSINWDAGDGSLRRCVRLRP